MSTHRTIPLRLAEGIGLAEALVARLSERYSVRVLLVKGRGLSLHGLRPPRVPGDLDVLVDPEGMPRLLDALHQAGWRTRPPTLAQQLLSAHSVTLIRSGWPCDLDVHHEFPGFLADPATVFEALWRSRRETSDGPLPVPGHAGSILILALHALRNRPEAVRPAQELVRLIEEVGPALDAEQRAELAGLAAVTACRASLEDVLPRLGIDSPPSADELASPALRDWRRRVASGSATASRWVAAIRRAPPRDRPGIVFRALWPTERDMRRSHPEVKGLPSLLLGRIARLGRGLAQLPRLRRAWRRTARREAAAARAGRP